MNKAYIAVFLCGLTDVERAFDIGVYITIWGNIGIWDKWTDRLNVWNSEGAKVKIQNFAIATNLYYGEQEFITEDIFNGHRDTYKTTEKR